MADERRAWIRALLAACVVLAAVAGCTARTDEALGHFESASATADVALDAARAWHPAAALMSIVGVEPNRPGAGADDAQGFQHLTAREDPRVGDGRAQAWMHTFTNQENASYAVVVSGSGEVLWSGPSGEDDPRRGGAGPLGEWSVDSDEAATIAAAGSAVWRNGTQPEAGHDAFFILFEAEDPWHGDGTVPLWIVGLEASDGGDVFLAFVNARNGSYMDLPGDGAPPVDVPDPQGGGWEGQLTLVAPEVSHPFEVAESGHEDLVVVLHLEPATATLNLTIRDPGGIARVMTQVGEPGADGPHAFQVGPVAAGAWTAVLGLETGVVQDYVMEWCAGGSEPVGDDDELGCGPADRD